MLNKLDIVISLLSFFGSDIALIEGFILSFGGRARFVFIYVVYIFCKDVGCCFGTGFKIDIFFSIFLGLLLPPFKGISLSLYD